MAFSFLLKKTISFFIGLPGLILLLSLIGLYYLFRSKILQAKVFLSLAFILLAGFSYQPVANYLSAPLERMHIAYQAFGNVDYIHVLGNGHNDDLSVPVSSSLSSASTKRVLEAVMIYNKKLIKPKIIFTGYAGIGRAVSNAQMNAKFARALGVNKSDIIINPKPKDTSEEASWVRSIIDTEASLLLVTSAMHMPRAMQLFQHNGLTPIPAPTDFKTNTNYYFSVPNINNLQQSALALHEYIGMLWIAIKMKLSI